MARKSANTAVTAELDSARGFVFDRSTDKSVEITLIQGLDIQNDCVTCDIVINWDRYDKRWLVDRTSVRSGYGTNSISMVRSLSVMITTVNMCELSEKKMYSDEIQSHYKIADIYNALSARYPRCIYDHRDGSWKPVNKVETGLRYSSLTPCPTDEKPDNVSTGYCHVIANNKIEAIGKISALWAVDTYGRDKFVEWVKAGCQLEIGDGAPKVPSDMELLRDPE